LETEEAETKSDNPALSFCETQAVPSDELNSEKERTSD
jgi:hypothetical protein